MNYYLHKVMREAFSCIAGTGSGKHNNVERGTTELSVNFLGPLAATMANFDWECGKSFNETRAKLGTLSSNYPDVIGEYPALSAFASNEESSAQ